MRRRRRSAGYLVAVAVAIGAGLVGTFVLGRTYSALALQKEPFHRLSYVPSFDPVEDVTLGVSPNSGNLIASTPNPSIRAIEVYPTQTILLAGGKAVRSIDVHAPATLARLVRVVHEPGSIRQRHGTVTMNAAVIVQHGSRMTVAAPLTSRLVMTVRPGVFLAASQATLNIFGVDVRASDPNVPHTFTLPRNVLGRPFVLAAQHSTMTITDSSFSYLGRDWNSSYGLSWSKGSTGSVTYSVFRHDFIGVYTNDSNGLKVLHNQFYNNSLYGVDPHSGSSHLVVEYNTANFNGRHGIIFSNHVTDGIVRYNVVRGNGLNGIMMDEASAHNVVAHNTVAGNTSDGIVLANSSHNVVSGNIVRDNRIGITVRGDTTDSTITGNDLSANELAAQGTGLALNTAVGNGGQWSSQRIRLIWLSVAALLLALLVTTRVARPRRSAPQH